MEEAHLPGLKDWTAIRAHLKRHDDEMIKDYEDDINTMLVFAGLFSAVVTAFIIESYQWLEQDDDQLSALLLAQISRQLAGGPVNQTLIDAAEGQTAFTASLSSIWINILWATSLLFSLTAALAGIIVKQWLREYLMWDSVLSPSREAVLLRHIRYDAWEKWKVPEIIATVPAVLEFALVLFLGGAVILLWTLDAAVAIVVTIFGVIFFVLACAANFLPLVFHRCPYKSATGWMCVLVWGHVCRWYLSLRERYHRSRVRTRGVRRTPLRRGSTSWRQRDLRRHRQLGLQISWDERHAHALDKQTRREVIELVILFHALAWVCTSTQDDRLLGKVRQCARNFHGASQKHLCLIAGVYATCQISSLEALGFFKSLKEDFVHEPLEVNIYGLYVMQRRRRTRSRDLWQHREPDVPSILMVGDVLLNVVQLFTQEMFPTTPNFAPPSSEEMQTFMETLSFLVHIANLAPLAWRENVAGVLSDFYNRLGEAELSGPWMIGKEVSGPRYAGFMAPILQLLTSMSSVEVSPRGDLSVLSIDHASTPEELVQLAIQLRRSNPHYVRQDDRHTFIVLADKALHKSIRAGDLDVTKDLVAELLACVDNVAQVSAEQNIPNLGYLGRQPMLLDTLVDFAQQRNPVCAQLIPVTLAGHLQDNLNHSLLPSETSSQLVAQLEALTANHATSHSHSKWASDTTATSEQLESGPKDTSPEVIVVGSDRKVSLDLGPRIPSPSMPIPYFPPTPFSMGDATDADLELGAIPYEFPTPQIPVNSLLNHPRTHTWPR
ncbi:hypothetical protein EIP86_008845 [Pleurotus ostreatoroseus]|nr:hypothetical protein EIP86_008845 [Pleurotus ostreatoroseus]